MLFLLLSEAARGFLATAALFLIIGGLAVLFLIVGLFLLQSLVPLNPASDPLPAGKGKRRLRPITGNARPSVTIIPPPPPGRLWRRRPDEETPAPRIDIALDRIVLQEVGEPRILRRLPNGYHLRLMGCKECASRRDHVAAARGCHDAQAKLLEACRAVFGDAVRVEETTCRGLGLPACEFEVRS